jgi:hypothetical protein
VVTGDIAKLRIPADRPPARAQDLWKHTCFEAFVLQTDGSYDEFNFAPSRSWAAYHFNSYRDGMRDLETLPPQIEVQRDGRSLVLIARAELSGAGRLGLSAVIETKDEAISYWAIAHPPGRADFHHSVGFVPDLRFL